MPEIARFLGIIIAMYYRDHAPPHIHAYYDEYEIIVTIEDGRVLRGRFPQKQLKILQNWCLENQEILIENWELARRHAPLRRIK